MTKLTARSRPTATTEGHRHNTLLSSSSSPASLLLSSSGSSGVAGAPAAVVASSTSLSIAFKNNDNTTLHHSGGHDHHDDDDGDDESDHSYHAKFNRRRNRNRNRVVVFCSWMWYQWRLLNTWSKMASALVGILILQHVVLGIWDRCWYTIGDNTTRRRFASTETTFAVVINTYKRPERLRQAVQHYAETCGRRFGVAQVFVIWAEQGVPVPEPDSFFVSSSSSSTLRKNTNDSPPPINNRNRSQIYVLQKTKDSLNSRFEPIQQLETTSVFMVDDDIRVGCASLHLAFEAWRAHPESMVGYYPRLASPPRRRQSSSSSSTSSPSFDLVYHAWPIVFWSHQFNFVLTKASFLHSKYLELYTSDDESHGGLPKQVKDHVDQHMNCEDIAMSMLVANHTAAAAEADAASAATGGGQGRVVAPPIYVEGEVSDQGLFGGISTGTGHMATRSECLTELTKIFVAKGWGVPLGGGESISGSGSKAAFSLSDNSWIHHAPGFWWQYRPSNVFEWLAFANTFT